MPPKIAIYDTDAAKQVSLQQIIDILADLDVKNIYVKKLAPNDNSKNQPYFGSHLTDLSFMPTGDTVASQTASNKSTVKKENKRKIKYQASVKLSWFDTDGNRYEAPNSKLIYYPQYPEVRFSGFLQGAQIDASKWMAPDKRGRDHGRWLILGVAKDKNIYAYLATPECALCNELENTELLEVSNVFGKINLGQPQVKPTKDALLSKLLQIHQLGWIQGQKLNASGVKESYTALNAGGYTLEAELGVIPNGIAEPDYLGWEVKQYGVKGFPSKGAKPTTLMTPEPNGGFYVEQGAYEFVRQYGYPDKSGKPDRLNFGGKHIADEICKTTNLTMKLLGFDHEKGIITDANGSIALLDTNEVVTANWSFAKLMDHWKKKHSQAVYIPCVSRDAPEGGKEYHFGKDVQLGSGTDFEMILSAMASGHAYYDPGIKLEHVSTEKPKIKKRSQFRVNHKELFSLYKSFEHVDVSENSSD